MTPPQRSILLVDDDEDIRVSLGRLVAETIPSVLIETAPDAETGLALLRANAFDVLVSDFRMPAMDGLEFLQEAKRIRPELVTLMMTAYPTAGLAGKAVRQGGVVMLVSKPFDPAVFVQLLRLLVQEEST